MLDTCAKFILSGDEVSSVSDLFQHPVHKHDRLLDPEINSG